MQFLVLLGVKTPLIRTETLSVELIGLEIQAVKQLLSSGVVRQAWRRLDSHAVALLVYAFNEQECRAILSNLPFSKAGILDIQTIVPVQPYLEVYPDP
jgi:muconolactone delta-isomerase